MKLSLITVSIALLLPATLCAQIFWQTTHDGESGGSCQLESCKLRLTVHPFYVDVEEEAVIATRGEVWWGDSSTLEIFGEFSLSKGSALRSLLLWNGSTILKAKLKDRTAADSAYEAVVNREKPRPIVRDPALIEYLGDDRYRIKIYPVRINNARKIRILYTVPYQTTGSGPRFMVMPAFLNTTESQPKQISVDFRKESSFSGPTILSYGTVTQTIRYGATYNIFVDDMFVRQYNEWGYWYDETFSPLFINPDTLATISAYTTCIDSGKAPGYYTAVYATLPDTIKAGIKEIAAKGGYTVEALVKAGDRIYVTDFNQKAYLAAYIKSGTPWDSVIHWTVYNKDGRTVMQHDQRCVPVCDSTTRLMLPLVWAAKYTLAENNENLGALYGFVDRKMSLLALESDSIPAIEAAQWQESGVPPLKASEIVLKPEHYPKAPAENILFEKSTSIMVAKADALSIASVVMMPNRMLRITLSKPVSGAVRVVLYDISGKVIATWNDVRFAANNAELALPPAAKGCMVVRVFAGRDILQKKIVVAR